MTSPAIDVYETGSEFIIEMELPGVAKSDVAITLLNNQELIVKGVKKQPRLEQETVTYYLFEREFGTFYKKIVIDFPLDTGRVRSQMENGVLTIEVSKRSETKIAKQPGSIRRHGHGSNDAGGSHRVP